jgi:hypothetical protein
MASGELNTWEVIREKRRCEKEIFRMNSTHCSSGSADNRAGNGNYHSRIHASRMECATNIAANPVIITITLSEDRQRMHHTASTNFSI